MQRVGARRRSSHGGRPVTLALLALALLALALGGCSGDDEGGAGPAGASGLTASGRGPELGPVELRVMTFNIWLGGELVDLGQVAAAVEAAEADVVGLQESEGHVARLAALLGWAHVDERLQLLSRFPLSTPPEGEGSYAYVHLAPGQVVAVANVHLPSDPYGPELVRDGATLDEVLANEEATRLPALEPFLGPWGSVIEQGMPLLLTGDFNTPSHRDWTGDAVGSRPHLLEAVRWPVTVAVEALGFTDTYRSVHPDPVETPGITWTFGYPYPRLRDGETQDRIDLVFAAGVEEVVDSQVVGPTGVGDVEIGVDPFPSDHLGVVSTVLVDPVEPPPYVAATRVRVPVAETVVVAYHAPGGSEDRIALTAAGAEPAEPLAWLPPQEADHHGRVTFGTGGLAPGAYDVVLVSDGEERSRSRFWVVDPAALPRVRVVEVGSTGAPITIAWESAPARKYDWVGIWAAGDPDLYAGYLAFAYTGATVQGEVELGPDDVELPPGDYVVRLLSDDGFAVLAEAPFSVG